MLSFAHFWEIPLPIVLMEDAGNVFYTWRAFVPQHQKKLFDFVNKEVIPLVPKGIKFKRIDPREYHVSILTMDGKKTFPEYKLDTSAATVKPLEWRILGGKYLVLIFKPNNQLESQIEKVKKMGMSPRFPTFLPHASVIVFDNPLQIPIQHFPIPEFDIKLQGEIIKDYGEPKFV